MYPSKLLGLSHEKICCVSASLFDPHPLRCMLPRLFDYNCLVRAVLSLITSQKLVGKSVLVGNLTQFSTASEEASKHLGRVWVRLREARISTENLPAIIVLQVCGSQGIHMACMRYFWMGPSSLLHIENRAGCPAHCDSAYNHLDVVSFDCFGSPSVVSNMST